MDTLTLVLLGVIAAASLAQAVGLVAVALSGRGIARRVAGFEQSLEREVRPALREAARLTRGLAEISDVTAGQAGRLSRVLDATAASVTARPVTTTFMAPLLIVMRAAMQPLRRRFLREAALRKFSARLSQPGD